jgi:hypothetical protein
MESERLYTHNTQITQYTNNSMELGERRLNTFTFHRNSSPYRNFSNSVYLPYCKTDDDIEIINLRSKLNELKKERIKSQQDVTLLQNRIDLLKKHENKLNLKNNKISNKISNKTSTLQTKISNTKSGENKYQVKQASSTLGQDIINENQNILKILKIKEKNFMELAIKKFKAYNSKYNKYRQIILEKNKLEEEKQKLKEITIMSNKIKVNYVKSCCRKSKEEKDYPKFNIFSNKTSIKVKSLSPPIKFMKLREKNENNEKNNSSRNVNKSPLNSSEIKSFLISSTTTGTTGRTLEK